MDDQTLIESFRAERADRDPRARAAAWGALEARLAEEADAEAKRPDHRRRRGVLALAGGGAIAAIVAAILILGSGSTPEPAAAEVLHETAAVAASGEGAAALHAGPGQYYFIEEKAVEFEGWYPDSYSVPGGPTTRPGGFSALIPTQTQLWTSPEGGQRFRTTLRTPEFLSNAEQARWEEAGSPLPIGFEPKTDDPSLWTHSNQHVLQKDRGVLDIESPKPQLSPDNYPDLSNVPTDPKELRIAIERREVAGYSEPGKPLGAQETIEDLTGLLNRPDAGPALRAAAFNAVAEIPGVVLDRNATDLIGRSGYSVSYDRGYGLREEFIFDPETSQSLGERTVLIDPEDEPQWKGYEAGLIVHDVAFVESKVVDSTSEPEVP